jgi:two-component system, sporulation sensor kinase B
MLVIFVLLLVVAALFFATSPRNPGNRWAAYTLLSTGCGFLRLSLESSYVERLYGLHLMPLLTYHLFTNAIKITAFVSVAIFPFCFIVYALYTSGVVPKRHVRLFQYVLGIPVVLQALYNPLIPREKADFVELLFWVAPYLIGGSVILIIGALRKTDPLLRQSRAVAAIFFVPPVIIDLFAGYISAVIDMPDLVLLNTSFGVAAFVLFVVFATKTGILGLRIRLERQQLHAAMTGHAPGTAKLNHALKNQIGKIHLHLSRMQQLIGLGEIITLESQIQRIADSADHLLNMTNRMEWQTREMLLTEGEHQLIPLIDLALTHPLLSERMIRVTTRYPLDVILLCDSTHVREMFTNLVINAAEAATDRGLLEIALEFNRNDGLTVMVSDDGHGIPDELLPKVIQPFFTTKAKGANNFGLGLSYCYQVMQKHGGSLSIGKWQDKGTTVILSFPSRRVIAVGKRVGGELFDDTGAYSRG